MRFKDVQGTRLTPDSILGDHQVRVDMLATWNETQQEGLELGGWIYYNHASQSYRTRRAEKGSAMGISLTPAPPYKKNPEGYEIVADWHCHPGYGVPACRPSKEDIKIASSKNYFMLVMTGKKERAGGWGDLLQEAEIVADEHVAYRIWNII